MTDPNFDFDIRASLDGGQTWMDVAPCLCDQLAGEFCDLCGPLTIGQQLERSRQAQQLGSAILLGDMLVKILTSKPPVRMHWWQFWREKP